MSSDRAEQATSGNDAVVDPRGLSVLFVLPERSTAGGVHSVVQEAVGMCRLGVRARVAVRAPDVPWFLAAYRDLGESRELFLPFSQGSLGKRATGFDVVIATSYASVELCAQVARERPAGLHAYYVQDYEPNFFESGSERWRAARESYRMIPGGLKFPKNLTVQ